MGITAEFTDGGSTLTIMVSGDFDFSLVKDFKKTYNTNGAANVKSVCINLAEAVTIDSSALGIILAMQKELNIADENIKIINCVDVIRKIFKITNLDKKLNVS